MDSQQRNFKSNDWVQLVTSLAVIVGLILVVYELRQAKQLTAADIAMQRVAMGQSVDSAMLGERPMLALAKSCIGEPLSPEEVLILNEYYWALYDKFNIARILETKFEMGTDWEEFTAFIFPQIFQAPSGREWWDYVRLEIDPETRSIGDNVLENAGPPSCGAFIQRFQKNSQDDA